MTFVGTPSGLPPQPTWQDVGDGLVRVWHLHHAETSSIGGGPWCYECSWRSRVRMPWPEIDTVNVPYPCPTIIALGVELFGD